MPYPAGGPTDVLARLVAQYATADLGQPIQVDNRGGGAGVIGSVAALHAEADGHTLVLGTNQTHATNQSLLKNHPFDAARDFAGVAGLAEVPHILVVRKGLGANTVAELIALAKDKPGGLICGSTGVGSASHLAMELFRTRNGATLLHVPFRGSAPLSTELIAGRIDLSVRDLADGRRPDRCAVTSVRWPSRAANRQRACRACRRSRTPASKASRRTLGSRCSRQRKRRPRFAKRLYQAVARAPRRRCRDVRAHRTRDDVALKSPAELDAMIPAEIAKWAAVIRPRTSPSTKNWCTAKRDLR